MKANEHKSVIIEQQGTRHETRTRYEQNVAGSVLFDVTLFGAAARGPETPFGLLVCTPSVAVPADFGYTIDAWQEGRPIFSGKATSLGSRASAKLNFTCDSNLPLHIRVNCPASWKVKTRVPFWLVWGPLLNVYLQAKHLQNVPIG